MHPGRLPASLWLKRDLEAEAIYKATAQGLVDTINSISINIIFCLADHIVCSPVLGLIREIQRVMPVSPSEGLLIKEMIEYMAKQRVKVGTLTFPQ